MIVRTGMYPSCTPRKSGKGFTLIELLVVCAIIVMVTAIVLVNQNKYSGQVLLQSFAYDMALSIRQAQVYGISVQRFGTNTFTASYGVHFDESTPTSYVLFADAVTANGLYDGTLGCPQSPSAGSELVQCNIINRGYSIQQLCETPASGPEDCTAKSLDILFKRPEPDALISWASSDGSQHGCLLTPPQCAVKARIALQSPRGDTMSVSVLNNGQIAVDQKAYVAP